MFIIVPPQKSNNAGWICLGKPLVYWICESRTLQWVIMALYIMSQCDDSIRKSKHSFQTANKNIKCADRTAGLAQIFSKFQGHEMIGRCSLCASFSLFILSHSQGSWSKNGDTYFYKPAPQLTPCTVSGINGEAYVRFYGYNLESWELAIPLPSVNQNSSGDYHFSFPFKPLVASPIINDVIIM